MGHQDHVPLSLVLRARPQICAGLGAHLARSADAEAERREAHAGLQRSPGRPHGDGRLHRWQPAGHRRQLSASSSRRSMLTFARWSSCSARVRRWPISACSASYKSCRSIRRRWRRCGSGRPTSTAGCCALDDASGVEGEWLDAGAPLPEAVIALLTHCGETYLPFLAANRAGPRSRRIVRRPRYPRATVEPGAVPLPGQVLRRAAQEARGAVGRRATPARSRARRHRLPALAT